MLSFTSIFPREITTEVLFFLLVPDGILKNPALKKGFIR